MHHRPGIFGGCLKQDKWSLNKKDSNTRVLKSLTRQQPPIKTNTSTFDSILPEMKFSNTPAAATYTAYRALGWLCRASGVWEGGERR